MCFSFKCTDSDFHLRYFTEPNFSTVEQELVGHQNSRCLKAITATFEQLILDNAEDVKKRMEFLDRFRKAISLEKIPQKAARVYARYIHEQTMINASYLGYTDLVKDLSAKGIQVSIQTVTHYTPLHYAAQTGNFDLAKFILSKRKVVCEKETDFGRTALHVACAFRNTKIAYLLMKNNADLHAFDDHGNTPFHLAFTDFKRHGEDRKLAGRIGLFLFSKGADPLIKNKNNCKPIDLISKDDLDAAFSIFPYFSTPTFPRDVWQIILRHLPNDCLLENVRPTCKLLNDVSIKIVVNDLISKSNQ